MQRKSPALCLLTLAAGSIVAGCASRPEQHVIYLQPGQPYAVATLGAGDVLGYQIYSNDTALAARLEAIRNGQATVDAPIEIDDSLH